MSGQGKIILHALPPSANSACTRCLLKCAGLEFEEVNVYGKTREPDYIAKFPTNFAPAVTHEPADGAEPIHVSENGAIARYICNTFLDSAGKFYPKDLRFRAKIGMVFDYTQCSLYPLVQKAMYPDVGFPLYGGDVGALMADDKDAVAKAQKHAAAELEQLLNDKYVNIWLKDTKFVAGDQPTIADFRFGPILLFARVAVKLPERLTKYIDDLEAEVPGFKEATEAVKGFTADKVKA